MNAVDVLVAGAGQAGLAVGYFLKQAGLSFVLLDKEKEIGSVWKNRYDSLVLFTPRFFSALPGKSLHGDPEGYATKDEIANYLKSYAASFDLPVISGTEIQSVTKSEDGFIAETDNGTYYARSIIAATGPFQKPYVPELAKLLSGGIIQMHTAHYQNPSSLADGAVLVVSAGNSGAQIAVELSKDREVYLSVGHPLRFMPLQFMNKSIFWWFDKLGILHADVQSMRGRWLSKQPDPIFGYELKQAIRERSIQLKPRTVAVEADEIVFSDRSRVKVKNIVWATGFYRDYSWIQIPSALDSNGLPIHHKGISPVTGLYYVGMPWQTRRSSALIGGVGQDAEHIVRVIAERTSAGSKQ